MWVPASAGTGGLKPASTNDWADFHASLNALCQNLSCPINQLQKSLVSSRKLAAVAQWEPG